MYYVLKANPESTIPQYLDWLNSGDCKFKARSREPWVHDPSFEILLSLQESKSHLLSDLFECGTLDIVSPTFRDAIEGLGIDAEFVPVAIWHGEHEELPYYALHVLDTVAAVDVEASSIGDTSYGMIGGIAKLVLNDSAVQGHDLFKLEKTMAPITIASERVKEAIGAFQDVVFLPISEYKDPGCY